MLSPFARLPTDMLRQLDHASGLFAYGVAWGPPCKPICRAGPGSEQAAAEVAEALAGVLSAFARGAAGTALAQQQGGGNNALWRLVQAIAVLHACVPLLHQVVPQADLLGLSLLTALLYWALGCTADPQLVMCAHAVAALCPLASHSILQRAEEAA